MKVTVCSYMFVFRKVIFDVDEQKFVINHCGSLTHDGLNWDNLLSAMGLHKLHLIRALLPDGHSIPSSSCSSCRMVNDIDIFPKN